MINLCNEKLLKLTERYKSFSMAITCMQTEGKNVFDARDVLTGIFLTTVEPQDVYKLSERLYRIKKRGIETQVDMRRTASGFFSDTVPMYIGLMELAGYLKIGKDKKSYMLNEKGFKRLSSAFGKKVLNQSGYENLLNAINAV
jgi:hypothetical protein